MITDTYETLSIFGAAFGVVAVILVFLTAAGYVLYRLYRKLRRLRRAGGFAGALLPPLTLAVVAGSAIITMTATDGWVVLAQAF